MEYSRTTYSEFKDEELLELLRFSDQSAYKELYHRYWPILFRHARKMLFNDEEAKDLVQDLFVTLWNKAAELVIQSSFSAYLYGMVRYKVFDLIDKRKVQKRHLESLETFIHHGECTTDHAVRENELSRIIEREISMLPAKMREVFELSRKSNYSYRQIGLQMDISDQTVKKQIYNAIKILRFKLGSICLFLIFCIQ
jgi:RNA polymerase sigma-70 factor (family 1)